MSNDKEYELELKKIQFEAILAEYNVLRGEMDSYHHHQNEIINFLIVIIVGILGIVGIQDIREHYIEELEIIFLSLPVICLILACLYTDRTIRIIRIADYLHNHVRLQVHKIIKGKVFQWEIYKRKTKIFDRRITSILDKLRWAVFFFPSIIAIAVFLYRAEFPLSVLETILISVSGASTFLQFIIMFIVEETSGVKDNYINLED